jgi:hypothetical protein
MHHRGKRAGRLGRKTNIDSQILLSLSVRRTVTQKAAKDAHVRDCRATLDWFARGHMKPAARIALQFSSKGGSS